MKDRAIVEVYSDYEDYEKVVEGEFAGDGDGCYNPESEITRMNSEDFDNMFKPSLSSGNISAYLTGSNIPESSPKKAFNVLYSHAGNRIVIDAQSGKIKKVFPKIYQMNALSSGFIEFRKNADDEEYTLLDSNLNDTRFRYKNSLNEKGNGDLLVEISKNQKSVSVLYNQYSGSMEEIGPDFTNVVRTPNYRKLSYKNIEYFALRDGRTLFDKSIDFSEYDARKILELARDAQNNERYQEAIRHYQSYLKNYGKNPEVFGNLADCYLKSDDASQGLFWINKAIDESSGFNENYYQTRISILEKSNSHRELASDYETLADNIGYNRINYTRKAAYHHSKSGEHEAAINLLNNILPESGSKISEDDDLAWAYNQRGNSYFSLKKYQSALLDFTSASKCVKQSSTESRAIYANNIGLTYLRMENTDVACKYFHQACNLGKCDYMENCR